MIVVKDQNHISQMKTLLAKKRSAPVLAKHLKAEEDAIPLSSVKEMETVYKGFTIQHRKKLGSYLYDIEKSAGLQGNINSGNLPKHGIMRPQSTITKSPHHQPPAHSRNQLSKVTSRSSGTLASSGPVPEPSANFLSRQSSRPYTVGPGKMSSLSLLPLPTLPSAANLKSIFGIVIPPSLPESQRVDYVVQQLTEKLKKELLEIVERETQEGQVQEEGFEGFMKKLMLFEDGDVAAWVRINSQYKALGKKVQARLVEFLSDEMTYKKYDVKLSYDHVEKLDEYYDQLLEDLEHNQIQVDAAQKKIELPINYLMRKRVEQERKSNETNPNEAVNSEQTSLKKSKSVKIITAKVPTIKRKAERFISEEEKLAQKQALKTENDAQANMLINQNNHLTVGSAQTALARNLKWSKTDEQAFKSSQSNAKHLFSSSIPSAHYRDVSFAPSYLSLRKQSNLHNLQNFLLERLQCGEWLTPQEIKHILFSSKLTSAVLDRDYFRKATGVLSPEVKGEIIGLVADEIIKDYYSVLEQIAKARKHFLTQKNSEHKAKLTAFLSQLQRENESLLRVVDLKRWRANNWRYCRKMAQMLSFKQREGGTSRTRDSMSPGRKRDSPDLVAQAESEMKKFIREKRKINRNKDPKPQTPEFPACTVHPE